MNQLYFLEITSLISGGVLDEMLLGISGEKKERLQRYRQDIDRRIGICSEVLLRCLISRSSGADYRKIEIKTGRTGKPFLAGFPFYEFNISHTRSAAVVALSDKPVGVDIEKVKEVDLRTADRVFTPNELAILHADAEDQNLCFFDIWTKKEAFIKYEGTGLSKNLKSFDVTGSFMHVKFSTYMVDDYIISVCSDIGSLEKDLTRLSEPELIEMWRQLKDGLCNTHMEKDDS